jgi:hypothetical protein
MASRLFHSVGFLCALSLGSLSFACGDKGSDDGDDEGSGGMAVGGGSGGTSATAGSTAGGTGGAVTATVLYGFDNDVEGFKFEMYTPGEPYVNVGPEAEIEWDGGNGQDGQPGRLKLTIPFSDFNQLADIQINFPARDFSGKTIRAYAMLESGFSSDMSAPGGGYIFVKTGTAFTWAKGQDKNLPLGTWTPFIAEADSLIGADTATVEPDPTAVVSLGMQFYSGTGSATADPPTTAIIYVDRFTTTP